MYPSMCSHCSEESQWGLKYFMHCMSNTHSSEQTLCVLQYPNLISLPGFVFSFHFTLLLWLVCTRMHKSLAETLRMREVCTVCNEIGGGLVCKVMYTGPCLLSS